MSVVNLRRRHPAKIVLDLLLDGYDVDDGKEVWHYADGVFGVRREIHKGDGNVEEAVFHVDMNVDTFIKWAEKLPSEVINKALFARACDAVLKPERPRS